MPGAAWDICAMLPSAALTWQPTFMDFSVTQILLLYLHVAAQVSHSRIEILIFFLSRISAILSEYNLLSPMLNLGNMFPIFNSVCSTPRAFETQIGETGELLHSWFPYMGFSNPLEERGTLQLHVQCVAQLFPNPSRHLVGTMGHCGMSLPISLSRSGECCSCGPGMQVQALTEKCCVVIFKVRGWKEC